MRFVYGKPHPLVEHAWYLVTESAGQSFTLECAERGIKKKLLECVHGDTESSAVHMAILSKLHADRMFEGPSTKYMNAVGGGCNSLTDIIHEVESYDFPTWKWTIKDVKISKFDGGTHWYATLPDGRSIEWQGDTKWPTADRARESAKAYLESQKLPERVGN